VTRFARLERTALAEQFATLGPGVPTLCTGWASQDLLAHLILRERHFAAVGIRAPRLAGWTASVQAKLAKEPYPELVAKFRRPPWWSLLGNGPTDELVNLSEFFIHQEDLRRAQPEWSVRALPAGEQKALWSRVSFMARTMKRAPGAITLKAPGIGELATGKGGEPVTITGEPGEILLFVTGRQAVAKVELTGPDAIVSRLTSKKIGL
jgi:uncharacterized protein (TIGR03085 family)